MFDSSSTGPGTGVMATGVKVTVANTTIIRIHSADDLGATPVSRREADGRNP